MFVGHLGMIKVVYSVYLLRTRLQRILCSYVVPLPALPFLVFAIYSILFHLLIVSLFLYQVSCVYRSIMKLLLQFIMRRC